MLRLLPTILLLGLLLTGFLAQAQTPNKRLWVRRIPNKVGAVFLDSGLVLPSSVHIVQGVEQPLPYLQKTHTVLIPANIVGDSITIAYEVLRIPSRVFIRDVGKYKEGIYFFDEPDIKSFPTAREEIFSTPGINKTGTLTRGVSFGNTQSAFVNSQLNLQLQGQLSKELRLLAVISDQAVPFQPEGNTQTLREFDKVYIQLDHQQYGRITAGDIQLQNPADAFFLKYYKNVQGVQMALRVIDTSNNSLTTGAFAVAKGKFASVAIAALEGVQGPYSIRSPDINTNVVITANSERVFIDGRLLRRGYNQDYIIDYNTGELTFTNTVLITRYTRIRIDYEYIAQDYSRSIYQVGHRQNLTKSTIISINHYQEQDDKEKPFGFTSTTEVIQKLGASADTLSNAYIAGYSKIYAYTKGQIIYTKIPPFDALGDSVFEYIATAAPFMYSVSFTPAKVGDYELVNGFTNGKIYRYVGRGRGGYLPVRPVTLPNKKAVSTISLTQKIGQRQILQAEMAFGQSKLNLYDPTSKSERNGQALHLNYQLVNQPTIWQYQLTNTTQAEYITAQFKGIDRFRPIEFDRDWGAYSGDTLNAAEKFISNTSLWKKTTYQYVSARAAHREKGINVNGNLIDLAASQQLNKLRINGVYYAMKSQNASRQSNWQKAGLGALYSFRQIEGGYQYLQEKSAISVNDSVLSTTNDYQQHTFSISSPDTGRYAPKISYTIRQDRLPALGKLEQATRSETFTAQNTFRSKVGNTLATSITARSLKNLRPELFPSTSDNLDANTIMGRLDWNGTYLAKCIRSELTLASNNGRELQREYRFIQTPIAGEGTHYYLGDLNDNGLQDLEEFVEATRPEQKLYIKIFVPTNTYIRAYSSNLNYRISLQAPAQWRVKGKAKAFVARFSHLTTLIADHRTASNAIADRLNPLNMSGTSSLGGNRQIRSSTFFNRAEPDYGGEFSYTSSESRQLVANGFERRFSDEYRLQARKNLSTYLTLAITTILAQKGTASDYLANRNYLIAVQQYGTELSIQPKPTVRIGTFCNISLKQNRQGTEQSQLMKLGTDLRLSTASVRTVNATLAFTRIGYTNGQIDSPIAYDMLEALSPGNNVTMNINFQQKLANGLQLLLSYDGRKSGSQDIIHLGKVQLTALF